MTRSAERRAAMLLMSPTWSDLLHVCRNMREIDWRECEAIRSQPSAEAIARELYQAWPMSLVAHVVYALRPAEPVAALLIMRTNAGQANVTLLATPRFSEVAAAFTRHALRHIRPMLLKAGIVRMECRTLEDHRVSRRWLRFMGAVEECLIPDGGKDGETFVQYAWRKSDVPQYLDAEIYAADDHGAR